MARPKNTPRIAHTLSALKSVEENWGHTHGTNPDGDIICVPCMAELLLDINELVAISYGRTSDGRLVLGDK